MGVANRTVSSGGFKTMWLSTIVEGDMAGAVQDRLVGVEAVRAPVIERAPVGAEKTFRAYDPDQVLLMAPCLQDWVLDGASRAVRLGSRR